MLFPPRQGPGDTGTGVSQPEKLLGFTSGTVLPLTAGEMENMFPSFSSARAETHYKCLCSKEGEWDIVAVFKTKLTPCSLFRPQ